MPIDHSTYKTLASEANVAQDLVGWAEPSDREAMGAANMAVARIVTRLARRVADLAFAVEHQESVIEGQQRVIAELTTELARLKGDNQ